MWELELWKRSEQTKFNAELKQKEQEYLVEYIDEWKIKEKNREIAFSKSISDLSNLENKLRSKAAELQKREGNINILENELNRKIEESIKNCANKEEDILELKRTLKEVKNELNKEKLYYENKIDALKLKIQEQEEDFRIYKREQEESSISTLRIEIAKRDEKTIENEKQFIHFNDQKIK